MKNSSEQIRKQQNIKIVGITDGDPFDKTTWSGSSCNFFNAVKKLGCLEAGISGLPSSLMNRLYQIKNFNLPINFWKFQYHIDTAYYKTYTHKVARELTKLSDTFTHTLQVYSHYDVPSLIKDKKKIKCAYQDGNLACLLKSPSGYPHISQKKINKALLWEKKVFGGLDYIFTFSEWLRQSFIEDYQIDPDKVIVVGAGSNIPIPETNPQKEVAGKTILFIGIDFERKGGKILLKAFKKVKAEIPDVRLLIVGPTQLKGLPDGVTCLGFISKNTPEGLMKLKQVYLDASIFVMPSLYEPFGVVFLEAMAHGLPCIGTDNCAMPEIIDHEESGFLIPPGDHKSLSDKIIELLKQPVLAKKMGEKGHKKALEHYTWDNVAQKVIDKLL